MAAIVAASAFVLLQTLTAMLVAADEGVQIVPEAIDVRQQLAAGTEYRLPDVTVTNPGSVLTAYQMAANPIRGSEQALAGDWFVFSPQHFSLQPRKSRVVSVRLNLPANATAGSYAGILRAEIVVNQTGAHVSAAAGSRVSFRVAVQSATQQPWTAAIVTFQQHLPWSAGASGIVLVVAAGVLLNRRYKIRLERKR